MATHLNDDLVRRNQILKSQLELEDIARRNWHKKWGFLLDFNKIYMEEAAKKEVLEDIKKRNKNNGKSLECNCFKSHLTPTSVPKISSGMIGWRSEYSLERMGKLYTSPLHTLPTETAATHIKLG